MAATTPLSTLSFRLLIAGTGAEGELTGRLATLGLKPKHVALLSALKLGAPGSQADLAATLHVAPSLVVAFADHLEALGAIVRERDAVDRRRQQLVLTDEGRRLLDESQRIAEDVDTALTGSLSDDDRAAVARFLAGLAGAQGVPVED